MFILGYCWQSPGPLGHYVPGRRDHYSAAVSKVWRDQIYCGAYGHSRERRSGSGCSFLKG